MSDKLFYLRSCHGDCGNNVMFHGKDGAGYVTDLDKADVITLQAGQRWVDGSRGDLPLLKSAIDALTVTGVDMQHLDSDKAVEFDDGLYIKQISGKYDGNDICFLSEDGEHTFDYGKAMVFEKNNLEIIGQTNSWWPRAYISSLQRRVIKSDKINTRKMITGPGIKYKKPRESRTTGKVRMNCPVCGKIHWQFNPYDFEGCNDFDCSEWKHG